MHFLLALALLAGVALAPLGAADPDPLDHVVPFAVVSVYDGDTITGDASIWPGLTQRTAVRVRGIDTPEIRGGCPESRALAKVARGVTDSLTQTAYAVALARPGPDKYGGRVVADVLIDGRNLADLLLARGVARPYDGDGKRPDWCGGSE